MIKQKEENGEEAKAKKKIMKIENGEILSSKKKRK